MSYRMVIAVRGDVRMGKGKTAAQVAHAAVTAALAAEDSAGFRRWLADGQGKIVVKTPTLEVLEDLMRRGHAAGVRVTPIADGGLTQLEPGTLTCCAFGPADEADLEPVTGGLPLL